MTASDNARIGNGAGFFYARLDERTSVMDGEQNGMQEQQGAQQEQQAAQQQAEAQQETQGKHAKPQGEGAAADAAGAIDAGRFEAQLAERDTRIAELEAQIAEAARCAETADGLREEIAALKQQRADERVEFSLLLAGCRNVKAAKAVLEDHGGDVDALKAAEPWMFADSPQKQAGRTGLPNAEPRPTRASS